MTDWLPVLGIFLFKIHIMMRTMASFKLKPLYLNSWVCLRLLTYQKCNLTHLLYKCEVLKKTGVHRSAQNNIIDYCEATVSPAEPLWGSIILWPWTSTLQTSTYSWSFAALWDVGTPKTRHPINLQWKPQPWANLSNNCESVQLSCSQAVKSFIWAFKDCTMAESTSRVICNNIMGFIIHLLQLFFVFFL